MINSEIISNKSKDEMCTGTGRPEPTLVYEGVRLPPHEEDRLIRKLEAAGTSPRIKTTIRPLVEVSVGK